MSHTYKIRDSEYFRAGRNAVGEQVLIGTQLPEIVMLNFDASGVLRDVASRTVSANTEGEIESWMRSDNIVPGTIEVQLFSIPERSIEIQELPAHYREFLQNRDRYDELRQRELSKDVEDWRGNGDFVLQWDEEYFFSQDGDIIST